MNDIVWYFAHVCANVRSSVEKFGLLGGVSGFVSALVKKNMNPWTHETKLEVNLPKPSGPCLLWLSSLCCWSWCWGTFHPVHGFKSLIIFKRKVAAGDQLEVMQARKSEDILKMSFRGMRVKWSWASCAVSNKARSRFAISGFKLQSGIVLLPEPLYNMGFIREYPKNVISMGSLLGVDQQ